MKKHPVKFFSFTLLLAAVLSLPAGMCRADEVVFLNGDRLTGKLVDINNENVTFNPELMGIITFDITKVTSLATDEPVTIHFDDGNSITATTISFEKDKLLITGFNTGSMHCAAPQDVFSVKRGEDSGAANWKGSISGGFSKTNNDEDTTSFNAILQLQRRSPKHRLRTRGVLFIEKEKDSDTRKNETSEENYTADVRYDYFFKKKWFWGNSFNYKRDIINDLDYRIIAGSSLGYQWLDSATNKLDTTAGLAYTREQYSNKDSSRDQFSDEDYSYLSYLFGVNLNCKIWDKVTASLDATITPKVNDPSDYIARGFGGIKLMATESLYVNFNTIFEYNSQVKRSDSTDTKFIFGVGWDFL
jgi:hypothetical protein